MTSVESSTEKARRTRVTTPGTAGWLPLLLLPVSIGMLVVYFAAVYGLSLGFSRWNFITPPAWVGLANFEYMFQDRRFWKSLANTATIVGITVPLKVIIGLALAILLTRVRRFGTFFRLALFFPTTASTVAVAFVWTYVYQPEGLLNSILTSLGFDDINWLSPGYALSAVNIMIICSGVGYIALLYLGGLVAVPQEYYEAARIDGASQWKQFTSITLPLLTPTTFFVVVTSVIGAIQTFGEVYVIDGPLDSTLTIASYIYERAFTGFEMGYASAMSGVLIVVLFIVTALQLWFQRRWVTYDR